MCLYMNCKTTIITESEKQNDNKPRNTPNKPGGTYDVKKAVGKGNFIKQKVITQGHTKEKFEPKMELI